MPFEFRQAWWLCAALLAVPIYIGCRRSIGRVRFSSLAALPPGGRRCTWRTRLARLPDVLFALAAAALAVALAGPRVADKTSKIERHGIAIMMVIDTSGSMRALDMPDERRERTRLDAVKEVFSHFVLGKAGLAGRPNDLVGLVTFARYADTRAPLTLDHDSLAQVLAGVELVTERDEDGTAIGDGLALAVTRLRESKAGSKIAIVLTDGVENAGETEALAAAELARQSGVKVYTVGAGTNGLAPVRVEDPFTGRQVLTSVPVEIDEATLEAMATKTGGRYFRATDADGLVHVYQEIDRLERTKFEEERFLRYRELYPGLVLAGLILLACSLLLGGTVLRRLP